MFGRKRRLPSATRPALERDERVVAWAPTVDAGAVVVTNRGLWLPGRERLGWHQIHKASWSAGQLTVVPSVQVDELGQAEPYAVMSDDTAVVVGLTDPGEVPAQVRDRVTRSVAYTAHHALPGGGVRVVGRRVPGADGLAWHVRFDDGTDRSDPDIMAATATLVTEAAHPSPSW